MNEPMIRHWCEAMGDATRSTSTPTAAKDSVHGGIVAPPTMLQALDACAACEMRRATTMPRNKQHRAAQAPHRRTATPAVRRDRHCEQGYTRYLRPGDRVTAHDRDRVDLRGEGDRARHRLLHQHARRLHATRTAKRSAAMTVPRAQVQARAAAAAGRAESRRRAQPPKPTRLKPPLGHDNGWWWEASRSGELPIQRCTSCGMLRHPPRPMCGACQLDRVGQIAASGGGAVYSFTVLHYPQVPRLRVPARRARSSSSTRARARLEPGRLRPDDVKIGMRVQCSDRARRRRLRRCRSSGRRELTRWTSRSAKSRTPIRDLARGSSRRR